MQDMPLAVRRRSTLQDSSHTCSNATQISASEETPIGSMLSRMLPSNKSGLCGTIEMADRTVDSQSL